MLTCHGITYHYDQSDKGITNLDFSVEKGRIIGVIGENGAGKSTLFKCLLGLLKPSSGHITYQGESMAYNKKALIQMRQGVNMVLQDPERQIFYSSVYEDVSMGPQNLGLPREVVHERTTRCIQAVDAHDFIDQPIQYLSFGQKKRVAIAGVLALNCDVLLLDEPETGLDPRMKGELMKLLKRLSEDGNKIVIASHNMDLIYMLCDYVYILNQGVVLSEGHPSVVMMDEANMSKAHLDIPIILQLSKSLDKSAEELRQHLYKY